MDDLPKCCSVGFHFCEKAIDCFSYYAFNSRNKVAEVVALGNVDKNDDDSKVCTNKIKIERELDWHEVLDIVNVGKNCTGLANSGDFNSGDHNSGDRNSGDFNSGNRNSGNFNSGNRNSGDHNSGNRNSGDWNKANYSNGCFNTESTPIYFFNKPSGWTFKSWRNSAACRIMNRVCYNLQVWVSEEDMTESEKTLHPEYKTTRGYLKQQDISEVCKKWWSNLTLAEKDCVMSLPNFDADIFEEITGVNVNE